MVSPDPASVRHRTEAVRWLDATVDSKTVQMVEAEGLLLLVRLKPAHRSTTNIDPVPDIFDF